MQVNGGLWNRLYYTAGAGLENNAVFGFAAAPRASLAYYLAKPENTGILSGTRLVFNFGKGFKEPSIYDQTNSLYDLLQTLPVGKGCIAQYGILPLAPEPSRTYDGGVQQSLLHGKAPRFAHFLPQRVRRTGRSMFRPRRWRNLACHRLLIDELEGTYVTGALCQQPGLSRAWEPNSTPNTTSRTTCRCAAAGPTPMPWCSTRSPAMLWQPSINPAFPNITDRSVLTRWWARGHSTSRPTPATLRWTGTAGALLRADDRNHGFAAR